MENSEVLQRHSERADMVTKRLRELLESRRASVCEASGVGNGDRPKTKVKELMQNVECELEVAATVHELRLEYNRQRQERSTMEMEVARLKEQMSMLTRDDISDCPESTSVGANSSRILALENMITTSWNSLDLMSSQLLEAENRKPAFSGRELWGQFCTLADAEEIMNFLVNLASSSRLLLRDREVDCREKDSEIRDLKEEIAKLKLRAFVFQRASVSEKDDFFNSDEQVSQQHEYRESDQGNTEALEEEQLEVSSDVQSQNAMDEALMASGVCSSVLELEEGEITYYPESVEEHHDWNSSSFLAFEYDEPLSPTEAYHLDHCREIFRSNLLKEESMVECVEISTCFLPSDEEERNFDDQQSSMIDTLVFAEEPAGNSVGDEQQQQSGICSASQPTMKLDTLLTNGNDNTIEKEDLIEIGCQNHENLELSNADRNENTFAAAAIRRGVNILHETSKANMFQNMNILREYGVPESNILGLLIWYPDIAALASSQFREISEEVKEKGFDPLMVNFILAMVTLQQGMKITFWERSVDCYKKFGLPDEDVIRAFKEKPYIMEISEEKITHVMDYYTNVMGLDPSFVCQRLPLQNSMTKRMFPRGLVAKVLLSKGLIGLDHLTQLFNDREEHFVQKFLTKYKEQAPELLKLYKAELQLSNKRARRK